jgi:hypothetical protein
MNNPYPWAGAPNTNSAIAAQTEASYFNYQKTKAFEDVGYFLQSYVVSGGVVTKNVTENNKIDVTDIVVSLSNDLMSRDGTSFKVTVPSTTYYLDFTSSGDWNFGTSHASGTSGTDYLPIASVTTDNNGMVLAITDTRGKVGGLVFKSDYPILGAIDVTSCGAKGDGVNDDTAAIQAAIDKARTDGIGTVFLPAGNYLISSFIDLTDDIRETITLIGAGIGITTITAPSSDAIRIKSYLVRIMNLTLVGSGVGYGINVQQLASSGDAVVGRCWIEYVQATGFISGLITNNFDQMWINKCNFGSNSSHGINVNTNRGGALLHISDTITNTNGGHGVYIFTTSILGHITVVNHEAIVNTLKGVHIEGSTTNTILSLLIDNVDIEGVIGTSNSALYLKNVWKFTIRGGQYTAKTGNTILAAIHMDACRSGFIVHPWLRSSADGNGDVTNQIYATNGTNDVYLLASRIFGTPVDFTVDGSTDKSTLHNLDTDIPNTKKRFHSAKQFTLMQGVPVEAKILDYDTWRLDPPSLDTNPAIGMTIKADTAVKSVKVFWFNNGAGSGTITLQLGFKKVVSGGSLSASKTFQNLSVAALAQNLLNITTFTPSDTSLSGDILPIWIIRNTGGTDTLTNSIAILGVEIIYQ